MPAAANTAALCDRTVVLALTFLVKFVSCTSSRLLLSSESFGAEDTSLTSVNGLAAGAIVTDSPLEAKIRYARVGDRRFLTTYWAIAWERPATSKSSTYKKNTIIVLMVASVPGNSRNACSPRILTWMQLCSPFVVLITSKSLSSQASSSGSERNKLSIGFRTKL